MLLTNALAAVFTAGVTTALPTAYVLHAPCRMSSADGLMEILFQNAPLRSIGVRRRFGD